MNLPAKTRKLPSVITLKNLVCLSVILLGLFLVTDSAYALKMNIDPPRVEMSIRSGEEQGGHVSVLNYDDEQAIHVRAYVNDLVYLPDGSNDFLSEGTTPWSVADWLKISPTEFDIPAGKEVQVRYMAEVPQGAVGGRYGVVFFEVSPSLREFKDKTGAAINVRIGSIFLITVKGTETYTAQLQDLIVGAADENGVFEISCNISNDGNVLIRPFGSVKIFDSTKREIVELKLNEGKTGVLPGTSRQFSVQYDQGKITSGKYFAQVVLDYGGAVLLGGQTSFEMELSP